ncbi:hypothetical protein F5144DRAFT_654100 [Chaetomium tenue]|uniref:Uncharacterized protein n=1 Tax=Chaetomium tenue TaxID=1854479 RepID=A0ACB7P731_9PEZI|nr:hypothetical protein F5144DRAFT_654100 [Chaetomium globosum]
MDIMDSPPRAQCLDPVLPPMPRRQSCDRCHEQKVRCVTEGTNGAMALGGIAEEGDSNPDGHVVAAVPCGRCRKAGTVCVYSRNVGLGTLDHSQESTHEPVPPRRVSSPAATSPTCEQFTHHHNLGLDTPPPTEDWQTPSYRCDSTQPLTNMCPSTSFPAVPDIAYAPLFQDPAANLVPAAEDIVGGYSWGFPASSDYFLEDLAQINLRIHLAGRALPSPAGSPPPWSWPAANDAFDAACSLIDAVDQFAARRQVPTFPEPSSNPQANSGTIDAALDSSACLMVHASHQALLGVFEHLSTALLLHLAEQQQQHQTPPRTPPDAAFLPPGNTQALIMTNLISHLLNQLDRAFLSLSSSTPSHPHPHPHPQHQHHHHQTPHPHPHPGHKPNILRSMAIPTGLPPPGTENNNNNNNNTWQIMGSGAPADTLFNEMALRQRKVRGQVKAVERLLGRTGRDGVA